MVAKGHIVEENEQMEEVSATGGEVYVVDDSVGLLKKVQSAPVLLLLDERDCTFIELSNDDRYFIFLHF